jgi:hypothetical protein
MPEFAGTTSPRPDPVGQARVEAFIVEQHNAGRSLRELAELTDRLFSAVRNILSKHGVHRGGFGATTLSEPPSPDARVGEPLRRGHRIAGARTDQCSGPAALNLAYPG